MSTQNDSRLVIETVRTELPSSPLFCSSSARNRVGAGFCPRLSKLHWNKYN